MADDVMYHGQCSSHTCEKERERLGVLHWGQSLLSSQKRGFVQEVTSVSVKQEPVAPHGSERQQNVMGQIIAENPLCRRSASCKR